MSKKVKIVGGSLIGAVCIHAALALISSCRPSAPLDVGGRDGSVADAATDSSITAGDSALDAVIAMVKDAAQDVASAIVDAEVRDAHAQDAGGSCACPPPAPLPSYREQTGGVTTAGDNNWVAVPNTTLPVTVGDSGILDIQATGGVRAVGTAAACSVRVTVDGAGGGGDTVVILAGGVFAGPWSVLRRVTGLSAGTHTVELQITRLPALGTANCIMEGAAASDPWRMARLMVTPR
ncbi:MAG: hypothetical protein JWM10_5078 [Myxococcaceae bacterium]|nr:hypothetical protein [Myxococcaceae bacterium]